MQSRRHHDPLSTRLRDAILSLQPTVLLPLDDGNGPLRDIAGGNWNATVTGSPTYRVAAQEPIGRGVTWATDQYALAGRKPSATIVTASASTTDGATFTTASVALKAGLLYTLAIENSAAAADAVSAITGGPTFTSRATVAFNAGADRVSLWTAVPSVDYTGTLVIDFGAATQTGCVWHLTKWVGVDTTTNDGIVQTATGTGTSTTPLATLAAFASTDNATYGAHGNAGASTAVPGSGFTELADSTSGTPSKGMQSEFRSGNDTTVDATITSAAWGSIAAEVRSAGGAIPAPTSGVSVFCLFRTADTSAAGRHLVARNGAGDPSWQLTLNATHKLTFSVFQAQGAASGLTAHATASSTASGNDDRWRLAVGTFDGTTDIVYLDGVAASSASLTGSWNKGSSTVSLGASVDNANPYPGTQSMAGLINDRILTAADVAWLTGIAQGG